MLLSGFLIVVCNAAAIHTQFSYSPTYNVLPYGNTVGMGSFQGGYQLPYYTSPTLQGWPSPPNYPTQQSPTWGHILNALQSPYAVQAAAQAIPQQQQTFSAPQRLNPSLAFQTGHPVLRPAMLPGPEIQISGVYTPSTSSDMPLELPVSTTTVPSVQDEIVRVPIAQEPVQREEFAEALTTATFTPPNTATNELSSITVPTTITKASSQKQRRHLTKL